MSPSKSSTSGKHNKMNRLLFEKMALSKMLLSIALLSILLTPSCSTQSERQIQIPALKRTAQLGYLYNETTDEIIKVGVFRRIIPTEHILEIQNPTKQTDSEISNFFEKQFKLFNINENEAVNILTGITTPRGAAEILNKNMKLSEVSGTFLYRYQTVVQDLHAFHENLTHLYNKDILGHIEATHVVTSITWGATVVVTLDGSSIETHDVRKTQSLLNKELRNLKGRHSPSDGIKSNFSMSITSDIPLSIEVPTTAKEVKEILTQVPSLIASINQGKGIPIQYTVTPINMIRKHMGVNTQNNTAHKIDEFTLSEIIETFQDLRFAENRINEIKKQINGHPNCVPSQTTETVNTLFSIFQKYKTNFTAALKKTVLAVRSGDREDQVISDLLEDFSNSEFHPGNINHRFLNLSEEITKTKIDLCNVIQNKFSQIQYFGVGQDLITKLTTLQNSEKSVYVLFTKSEFIRNQPETYTESLHSLLEKQAEETNVLLFVNCDVSTFEFCNDWNDTAVVEYVNGLFIPSVRKQVIFEKNTSLEMEAKVLELEKKVMHLQNFTIDQRQKQLKMESKILFLENKTNALEQKLGCGLHPCLNGGKCSFESNSFTCVCAEAFFGNNCEHRNECVYPGTCASVGRYAKCECREGYVQDPQDSRKCKLENKNATLIFGSWNRIEQFSLKQGTVTQIQNQISTHYALDFLYRTNTVFWSGDENVINAAPIRPGASKTVVLNDARASFLALAVDWVYSHLYFADAARDTINVANLDGSMKKVLFNTGVTNTWAIVVNPLSGWIYWADHSARNIERAGMDGSRREVIESSPKLPLGLALDLTQNRLYWTSIFHPPSIHSMNVDGSDKKIVFQATQPTFTSSYFLSITTFGDFVYWRDYETKAVYKTNKCGGGEATAILSVAGSDDSWRTLQAYHYSKQPEGVDYCANRIGGQCSHLCFPTPSNGNVSVTTKCACPEGRTLSSNQQTCM